MAASSSPVELPTETDPTRRVEIETDIKNPQWIPILPTPRSSRPQSSHEKELSPYSGASSVPVVPSIPKSPSQKASSFRGHSHSKSSMAPEKIELEDNSPPLPPLPPPPPVKSTLTPPANFELPATRPTSRFFENQHKDASSNSRTVSSSDTETTVDLSGTDSVGGTVSTIEDNPSGPSPVAERKSEKQKSRSTTSSVSSMKKFTISPPTSKFNRKPAPPIPSRMLSVRSEVDVPEELTSRRSSPGHSRSQTLISFGSPDEQRPESPVMGSPTTTWHHVQRSEHRPSRSTASPQNQTPLKPSLSNASLASSFRPDRSPPTPTLASIQDSPRSSPHTQRKSSLKPPTGKIPRKEVQAKPQESGPERTDQKLENEDSREGQESGMMERSAAPVRLVSQPTNGPSVGIASFMTANNTLIFRRFDEVHVQLLLCLQDEITELERELMRLDSANITRGERDLDRNRVLRELRKVVAEYDHLFTSWNHMQHTKASRTTTQNLREWLQRPTTSIGGESASRDELQWLEKTQDLSAVSVKQGEEGGWNNGSAWSRLMGGICGKRK